ncbi:phage tail tube protein [Yinghuangia aomiensis]
MVKESLAGVYERIESSGISVGARVLRADQFVPNPKGAAGSFDVEVFDKGMGFLMRHCLGAWVKGTPSGGLTPYVGTVADLSGKSFSAYVGRVDVTGTLTEFLYKGGKVASWTLSNDTDGILMLSVDADFASETIQTTPAGVPTYPTGAKLFSFLGGVVTVDGSAVPVSGVTLAVDNGLKTDRYVLTGSKREPKENALREITVELKMEFESKALYSKVVAATDAGTLAVGKLEWTGVGTPAAKFTVDLPALRLDEGAPAVDGIKLPEVTLKDKATIPVAGGQPLTVTYNTTDVAE